MYKHVRKGKSLIPGAGDGVFAKINLPKDFNIGTYKSYKKPTKDLTDEEVMYAADCGNDIAAVGTGLGAKINDNVQFRPLTRQETRNIKHLGGDYPRYKDKPHNVTLARDDDDKRCNIYVQTTVKISKGK